MKNINLQNQYNGESIKMDGSFIMGLNKKWGISRMDFALELMEKYNLFWKEKFLDVGCGDGEVCKLVEGQFTEVYGIEIVEERIKRFYKTYLDSRIQLSLWDLNKKLDFQDSTFDCITSLVVLDWVYDLNNALSEIQRVLKKDGVFILEVCNLWFFPRRLNLFFWNYPKISAFSRTEWKRIGWDANVCHVFVEKELTSFLKEFGFEILEVSGSWLLYRFRNWWSSVLCGDLFYVLKKK